MNIQSLTPTQLNNRSSRVLFHFLGMFVFYMVISVFVVSVSASGLGNLRDTRWGMSQDQVLEIEGTNYLSKSGNTILYKVETAGLPSIVAYRFTDEVLASSIAYFHKPKLQKHLAAVHPTEAGLTFDALYEAMKQKYGYTPVRNHHADLVIPLRKELAEHKKKYDKLIYQRDDAQTRINRIRYGSDTAPTYTPPPSSPEEKSKHKIQEEQVKPIQRSLDELNGWIRELREKMSPIRSRLIKIKTFNEKGPVIGKQCHWVSEDNYDVSLNLLNEEDGPSLWLAYKKPPEPPILIPSPSKPNIDASDL